MRWHVAGLLSWVAVTVFWTAVYFSLPRSRSERWFCSVALVVWVVVLVLTVREDFFV